MHRKQDMNTAHVAELAKKAQFYMACYSNGEHELYSIKSVDETKECFTCVNENANLTYTFRFADIRAQDKFLAFLS